VQRRRFAQFAAIVALALAAALVWMAGRRGDEPLFERFVVAPGDDASALPLRVEDARLIEIDRTGALLVHTGARVRRQPKPRAYQEIDGRRRDVSVRFDIAGAGDPRLVVGPYDRTFPLVIDSQP
jgi:hypothetical protein